MKKFLVLFCAALLVTGCGNNKNTEEYTKLENNFKKDVATYYEENIMGQVYPPFSCQKITIDEMKEAGISVNEYTNKGCKTDSVSAIVVVTDDSDPANIKYEVVANLSCKDYSSKITNDMASKYQCLSTYVAE